MAALTPKDCVGMTEPLVPPGGIVSIPSSLLALGSLGWGVGLGLGAGVVTTGVTVGCGVVPGVGIASLPAGDQPSGGGGQAQFS